MPDRRRDDRDRDRARTPPRAEEVGVNGKGEGKERDRAVTPPYDR